MRPTSPHRELADAQRSIENVALLLDLTWDQLTPPGTAPPETRPSRVSARRAHVRPREARLASGVTALKRHRVGAVLLVALLALTPLWITLVRHTTEGPPTSTSAPSEGQAPNTSPVTIPEDASSIQIPTGTGPLPRPGTLKPLSGLPEPGEGSWSPAGRLVGGAPAIYETFIRPNPLHSSVSVGVAWLDTKMLRATLYSGSAIPGGGPYTNTTPIPPSAAARLDAAFNAGLSLQATADGYYTDGRTISSLRAGEASVVINKDGSVAIGAWGSEVSMSAQVESVRQNLELLVDGGRPEAGLSTVDGSWRSGLGETSNGALVYVGGPNLTTAGLAGVLVRAGSVRAMELDDGPNFVNFSTFAPDTNGVASPTNGTTLLPTMESTPARYFDPTWQRDFFTLSIP